MQFKVKDIGEAGVGVDLAIPPAWLAQECPDIEAKPGPDGLRFKGRIERSGADFLLRGALSGALHTSCARCLEPATVPLAVEVSVVYVEESDAPKEDDDNLDAPDLLPFTDGVIDLGPELRDEILLALPTSPLCREECAGLCPVCGGNRNMNPCDCAEQQRIRESKFGSLGKFKS
jgi:uncharacterized metal-binding protein YceD (DUF177 family)